MYLLDSNVHPFQPNVVPKIWMSLTIDGILYSFANSKMWVTVQFKIVCFGSVRVT